MEAIDEDGFEIKIPTDIVVDYSEFDGLTNEQLVERLAESQRRLHQSATLGKSLLEQKEQITSFYEEERKRNTVLIEELRQENHGLQAKFDVAERTIASVNQEVEDVEKRLTKAFGQEKEQLVASHESESAQLKRQSSALLHENNKLCLQQKQLQEDIEALKIALEEERLKASDDLTSVTHGTEMFELHEKIISMETQIESQEAELRHNRHKLEEMELDKTSYVEKISALEKEIKITKSKEIEFSNDCKRAREECHDLQTELDILKAEADKDCHLKRGNSLFSEVYDKQIEAQQKYISVKTKYDALVKVAAFQKEQLCKMKTQILGLLQMKGADSDANRIHQLESALSQKRGEITDLTAKISNLEGLLESADPAGQIQKHFESFLPTSGTVNKGYLDFVLCKLKNSQEETADLNKKLEKARLIQLSEFDKFQASEKKLYSLEEKYDQVRSENLRLKATLDETRNKLRLEKSQQAKLDRETSKDERNISPKYEMEQKLPPSLQRIYGTEEGERGKVQNETSTLGNGREQNLSSISVDTSLTSDSISTKINDSHDSSQSKKKEAFKRPFGMSDADYKLYKVLPKDLAEKLIKKKNTIPDNKENSVMGRKLTTPDFHENVDTSVGHGKIRKVSFKEHLSTEEPELTPKPRAAITPSNESQPLVSALKKSGDKTRKVKVKPRVAMVDENEGKPECNQQ